MMHKDILNDNIKGIIIRNKENVILEDVSLDAETLGRYGYPILTAQSFLALSNEGKPFSIIEIMIDGKEVLSANIVMGIQPILQERPPISIEFTAFDAEPQMGARYFKMWQDYITDTNGNNNEKH